MGDPERTKIPIDDLLSTQRIKEIKESIDVTQTFEADYYGTSIQLPEDAGTQHISIIDKMGLLLL